MTIDDRTHRAMLCLGNAFLQHPNNDGLRRGLADRTIPLADYHRQLLRTTLRMLILLVMSDRGITISTGARSIADLRTDESVSWLLLVQHFGVFDAMDRGDLFGRDAVSLLYRYAVADADVTAAMHILAGDIDYTDVPLESLGAAVESAMATRVVLAGNQLHMLPGAERKTTGSYYTPPSLIAQLLETSLEPVIAQKLAGIDDPRERIDALLSLNVCDPACGTGHFLLAAARRITEHLLAIARTGGLPVNETHAVRCAIACCIYGVDLNPVAVDLCKVVLWIEGYVPGFPLLYLEDNIKCGNALIGTTEGLMEQHPMGAAIPPRPQTLF